MAKIIQERYLSCDDEGTDHSLKVMEVGDVKDIPVRKTYLANGEFSLTLKYPKAVSREQRNAIETYTQIKLGN